MESDHGVILAGGQGRVITFPVSSMLLKLQPTGSSPDPLRRHPSRAFGPAG